MFIIVVLYPTSGEVALHAAFRETLDAGTPIVVSHPDSTQVCLWSL